MLTCGFFCYDKMRLKASLSLSRSRDWGGSRNSIRCGQVLFGPLAAAQTAIPPTMASNRRVEKIRVMLGIYYSMFLSNVKQWDKIPVDCGGDRKDEPGRHSTLPHWEHLDRAHPRNRLLSSVRSCGR